MNLTFRRGVAAAAVLVTAPVLSACQANFNMPTDRIYTPGVGVNERSGSVDVLHAAVVSGSDGSGTLIAALVNNDQDDADALIDVQAVGVDAELVVEVEGDTVIPPDGFVQLADEGDIIVLGEAGAPGQFMGVVPGRFVRLRFDFLRSESVTLNMPVVERSGEFENVPVPSS